MDDSDLFLDSKYRTDFIDCIKRNSNCKIFCVFIQPQGGPLQCLWAKSFALCEKKSKTVLINGVLNYFKEKIDFKDQINGTEEKTSDLYINRPEAYFNHEAMFIESHCLYQNNVFRKDVKELFKNWIKIKPSGRIIIIVKEM